jgi:hypothetical protein
MNKYTQKPTDSILEFPPGFQEERITELSSAVKTHDSYLMKILSDRIREIDRTLTTKQTEHAGLPFLPLFSNKEEGNGN